MIYDQIITEMTTNVENVLIDKAPNHNGLWRYTCEIQCTYMCETV